MMDEWQYHQDGRDRAVRDGCSGCLGLLIIVLSFLAASCAFF